MKNIIFTILFIFIFMSILYQGWLYYNTMVSYKYEVEEAEIHIKITGKENFKKEIEQRKVSLLETKKAIKFRVLMLSILFVLILMVRISWNRIMNICKGNKEHT